MSIWVVVLYGISIAIALCVVYLFHARWYWHVLSVLTAFAIGFSPPITGWDGASRDVAYGFVILFLLVWGLSEPFLHRFHQRGFRHT
ncbi:MAG: hypothetical protein U0Q18_05880 [Bryobacteraceae bacterium]